MCAAAWNQNNQDKQQQQQQIDTHCGKAVWIERKDTRKN